MNVVEISGLSKSFGQSVLFNNLSLSIALGEKVGIIGPGGSGKSILIKIAIGLLKFDSGIVKLFGNSLSDVSTEQLRQLRKKLGVAFQQGALFDFMTVGENLEFAMKNMTKLSKGERKEKANSLLAAVKLNGTENLMPHELSGGMQRRVGIARALSVTPTLAIFDEPTSGLDPVTSTIILNMISDLAKSNEESTQIIVTSNVETAMRFSRRIVIINDGGIVADGDWHNLLEDSSDWVKHFLSVRLLGLDKSYAKGLNLPNTFFNRHWG